ncbi:hypothetical protein D8841_09030 [Streptococcus mitis]|nr:hypothetical protein D8841_09030 [Streptococcus mitis]
MILGAIYIATSSEIKEDILFYQLNDIGQTLKVNLNDKLEYNPTIFEIYNWIYNTDNYICDFIRNKRRYPVLPIK